jgi:prepilin-type N-terminal cleavage/methylation domain-containing protein
MPTYKKQKGFTLIELLIVTAIIGILAAIAIPVYRNFQIRAKDAAANSAVGAFRTALELHKVDSGTYGYPPNQAALALATFNNKYINMTQIGASVTISNYSGTATTYTFRAVSKGTAGNKTVTRSSGGIIW